MRLQQPTSTLKTLLTKQVPPASSCYEIIGAGPSIPVDSILVLFTLTLNLPMVKPASIQHPASMSNCNFMGY